MEQPPAPPHRQSIAVVGLGGIGGGAAGFLASTGRYDITACLRQPVDRLVLEYPEGVIEVPLRAMTDPALATPVDWVILATKTHDTASAGLWLKRLCNSATTVVALQNGIDHVERIAPYANGATIVPALVYYNGERLAPDRVRVTWINREELVVPDDAGGRAFAALLAGTPLRVQLSNDFVTLKWRKLLLNAIANPIPALTLQRFAVFQRGDIGELSLAILEEAIHVARADGAKLADDEAARVLAMLRGFSPDLGSSMYFDRLAGKPFEVEALTGAIVAAGKRHGIATPLNGTLLTLLRAISEENAKAQSKTQA